MFQSSMTFPKQTVLAKTFSLNLKANDPSSRRRIETQLLHYDGRFWRGYTYAWNDEQTDAELVEPHGREMSFSVTDAAAASGRRDQTWHFPSRVECARCHNQWAEYALAFNIRQLNRDVTIGGHAGAQLDHFKDIGLVELPEPELPIVSKKPAQASAVSLSHFENPYRESADINRRARSWLHVNCAHCHRTGGGGAAYLELREELPLEGLKVLDVKPTQGTFEIADSRILSPGNPYRSTLYYRVSKTGSGRMPHIGSDVVDERGVKLIHDWIEQLPVQYDAATLLKKLKELDDAPAEAGDQAESATRLLRLTQEAANQRRAAALKAAGKDDVPTDPAEITDTDRKAAATLDQRQAQGRKAQRAKDRAATIKSLLSSTSNALVLARAVLKHELSPSIREQAFEAGAARPEPQVRDLFEQFLPAERRVKRLGASVRPKDLLALKGDAARGRELFFNTTGIACKNCHRIGEVGSKLGPELTLIAKKNSRAQILDSILEPSKQIDPKYVSYVVQTSDGKVLTGLLTDRNPREIVLRNGKNEEVRIPADSVEEIAPQRLSIMPELLLKDMTAEQVGDLLEFLATLK